MRVITNTEEVKINVSKSLLLNGKYLPLTVLSTKLKEIEEDKELNYKQLRNKMYNSKNGNKYNTIVIAGIDCIDTEEPMKGRASLELKFEVA